jgi:hypothetical protein
MGAGARAFEQRKRRFANYIVPVVQGVFTWGLDREHVTEHNISKIKPIKRPQGQGSRQSSLDARRHGSGTAASHPTVRRAGLARRQSFSFRRRLLRFFFSDCD